MEHPDPKWISVSVSKRPGTIGFYFQKTDPKSTSKMAKLPKISEKNWVKDETFEKTAVFSACSTKWTIQSIDPNIGIDWKYGILFLASEIIGTGSESIDIDKPYHQPCTNFWANAVILCWASWRNLALWHFWPIWWHSLIGINCKASLSNSMGMALLAHCRRGCRIMRHKMPRKVRRRSRTKQCPQWCRRKMVITIIGGHLLLLAIILWCNIGRLMKI